MTEHSTNSSLRFACEIEFIHPKCKYNENIRREFCFNNANNRYVNNSFLLHLFFVSLLISSVNYDLYVAVY